MKKSYILFSALLGVLAYGNAEATDPICEQQSTTTNAAKCADMGYTITNIAACSGLTTLKCPFDDSKLYCFRSATKACKVGDILFNDRRCYASYDRLPPYVKPMAIVFDIDNKLAIQLTSQTGLAWETNVDQTLNISSSTNLDANGEPNSFIGHNISGMTSYRDPDICRCVYDISNSNVMIKDLDLGFEEAKIIKGSIAPQGNILSDGQWNINTSNQLSALSSFTANPTPAQINMFKTKLKSMCASRQDCIRNAHQYVSTDKLTGGYADTVLLHNLSNPTPAADYCYNLNTNSGSNYTSAVYHPNSAANVWFLPSVGDLAKLSDEATFEAVTQGLYEAKALSSQFGGIEAQPLGVAGIYFTQPREEVMFKGGLASIKNDKRPSMSALTYLTNESLWTSTQSYTIDTKTFYKKVYACGNEIVGSATDSGNWSVTEPSPSCPTNPNYSCGKNNPAECQIISKDIKLKVYNNAWFYRPYPRDNNSVKWGVATRDQGPNGERNVRCVYYYGNDANAWPSTEPVYQAHQAIDACMASSTAPGCF